VEVAVVWEFLVKVLVVLADVYINVKIVVEEEDQVEVRDIQGVQEDTRLVGKILHAGMASVVHTNVPPQVEDLEVVAVQHTMLAVAAVV
jgi:hypothetical protein